MCIYVLVPIYNPGHSQTGFYVGNRVVKHEFMGPDPRPVLLHGIEYMRSPPSPVPQQLHAWRLHRCILHTAKALHRLQWALISTWKIMMGYSLDPLYASEASCGPPPTASHFTLPPPPIPAEVPCMCSVYIIDDIVSAPGCHVTRKGSVTGRG